MIMTDAGGSADQVTILLVGAGNRGVGYSRLAESEPDRMRIAGIVDPNPHARRRAGERFGVPEDRQWASLDELPAEPVALAAINATMDALHIETSEILLERGYHLLLEKPIALEADEVLRLEQVAERTGRTVAICHVLRHAPFYAAIKDRVAAGAIGEILTIEMSEQVAYDHMASSYVRGPWRNEEDCGSGMLMAKCCHDLDLMTWFAQPAQPVRTTSAGSRRFFREENAPEGSGTRCVVDCAIEAQCPYSARRLYIEMGRWGSHAWRPLDHLDHEPDEQTKLESLASPENPFGQCVWRADNTVVDHQSVIVEFDNGLTATLMMTSGAARGVRDIHLVGSTGEIFGTMEDETFTLRQFDAGPEHHTDQVISTASGESDGHGGGDLRLVSDFVSVLQGRAPSLSTTTLADSINGHLVGFAAERGRHERRWVEIEELRTAGVPA